MKLKFLFGAVQRLGALLTKLNNKTLPVKLTGDILCALNTLFYLKNEGFLMLSVITIYHKPLDFPDSYVARRFHVGSKSQFPTNDYRISPTIEPLQEWASEQCRKHNQSEGLNMGREKEDAPTVVESWV